AQQRTVPATSDGRTRGSVTRQSTVQRRAPSVRAASSNRVSIERRPASTVMTRKGMATKVSARIAPAGVNGRWIPQTAARQPAGGGQQPPGGPPGRPSKRAKQRQEEEGGAGAGQDDEWDRCRGRAAAVRLRQSHLGPGFAGHPPARS